ncbi:hypothetical protein J4G48_0003440 [Bradyrhizobium barranii subsp. apii]|uniref:hypothetical protein n=1 Tax=Bradyrhizobium barranii TaxID=2992140 RepID=UPI001AA13CBC|nr:hypothetical protein [Bradyrhizobium barranii]UPT97249.1 hypothetical protein J4G48_0003440 [Bradyrhizobium barranii subsp. apii]
MAVAFDAQGHDGNGGSSSTSYSSSTVITVGSGSNRALVVYLMFVFGGGSGLPTGISVTWNGVAMTPITGASFSDVTAGTSIIAYGLVNPASGANTLSASWTGSRFTSVAAISFTGVDQTGGATSFAHGAGNHGNAGGNASVTVTSATGNITAAAYTNDGSSTFTATSPTQDFVDLTSNSAMNHTAGSASNTMTATQGGTNWVAAGVDVVAAAADVLMGQILM